MQYPEITRLSVQWLINVTVTASVVLAVKIEAFKRRKGGIMGKIMGCESFSFHHFFHLSFFLRSFLFLSFFIPSFHSFFLLSLFLSFFLKVPLFIYLLFLNDAFFNCCCVNLNFYAYFCLLVFNVVMYEAVTSFTIILTQITWTLQLPSNKHLVPYWHKPGGVPSHRFETLSSPQNNTVYCCYNFDTQLLVNVQNLWFGC